MNSEIYTAKQAIKDYNRFNSEVCEKTGTNCSETCPITLKNEYGCYLENINLEALQKWAEEAKKSDEEAEEWTEEWTEEDKINAYTTIKKLKEQNTNLLDTLETAKLCLKYQKNTFCFFFMVPTHNNNNNRHNRGRIK